MIPLFHEIEQLHSPNFEERYGQIPIIFVLHITDGQDAVRTSDEQEEKAVDNTFMSAASQCSSHGGVERDGRIKQYVDIKNSAWTQGLHGHDDCQKALSPIVRNMDINPNYYSLGIEYLAYKDHGGEGTITNAQFWSSCWLLKYWQDQVMQIYGHKIPLNSSYVIGHCHVDPVYRKYDPGVNFPWQRLYAELAIADGMSLADYEGRLLYMGSDAIKIRRCVEVWNEVAYLKAVADGVYGKDYIPWALGTLKKLYKAFADQGVLTDVYSATDDYNKFEDHIVFIYNTACGKNKPEDVGWAIGELNKIYPYMLSQGLASAV